MKQGTGGFGRSNRLLKAKDYVRVSRLGVLTANRSFVLLIASSSNSENSKETLPRLGMSMSRRVGNAVVRNRIKRLVREWFRRARHQMPGGLDLVVIGRPDGGRLEGREVRGQLDALVNRCLKTLDQKQKGVVI